MGPLDSHQRRDVLAHMSAGDQAGAGADMRLEAWERTFGHVVVDEAQDLSPMQLRVLGRRCPGGSMTLVGDLGQATGPWAPATWEEVVAHLPGRRPAQSVDLTVNYRTPAEVADIAARVLAVAAPELKPSRSVREAGVPPVFTRVASDELVEATVAAARSEVEEVAGGRVAVIAPQVLVDSIRRALPEAVDGPAGLDAPVTVLAVTEAKGLEFDSVCLVEPAGIVEERPRGGRALYVALTRTTRRLHVVHATDLPGGMHEP
jgi:DNA helicase IV